MEEILSNLLDLAIEAHGGLKLWREIKPCAESSRDFLADHR